MGHVTWKICYSQVLGQVHGSLLFPNPRPCHLEKICFGQVLSQVHEKFALLKSCAMSLGKNLFWPSSGPGTRKVCSSQVLGHVTWKFCSWSLNFSNFRKGSFIASHSQVGLLNWFLFFSLKGWEFVFFSKDLLKYSLLAVKKSFMEIIFFYESSKVALTSELVARSSTKMILSWCFLWVGDPLTGILEEEGFL